MSQKIKYAIVYDRILRSHRRLPIEKLEQFVDRFTKIGETYNIKDARKILRQISKKPKS